MMRSLSVVIFRLTLLSVISWLSTCLRVRQGAYSLSPHTAVSTPVCRTYQSPDKQIEFVIDSFIVSWIYLVREFSYECLISKGFQKINQTCGISVGVSSVSNEKCRIRLCLLLLANQGVTCPSPITTQWSFSATITPLFN